METGAIPDIVCAKPAGSDPVWQLFPLPHALTSSTGTEDSGGTPGLAEGALSLPGPVSSEL